MAEKEGKNINTALKGVLASDSTLIGLVGGNVRQIETDVSGGLMSFDKGVSKSDINVENGVTGFEPIGEVKENDNRAISGSKLFNTFTKNEIRSKAIFKLETGLKSTGFTNETLMCSGSLKLPNDWQSIQILLPASAVYGIKIGDRFINNIEGGLHIFYKSDFSNAEEILFCVENVDLVDFTLNIFTKEKFNFERKTFESTFKFIHSYINEDTLVISNRRNTYLVKNDLIISHSLTNSASQDNLFLNVQGYSLSGENIIYLSVVNGSESTIKCYVQNDKKLDFIGNLLLDNSDYKNLTSIKILNNEVFASIDVTAKFIGGILNTDNSSKKVLVLKLDKNNTLGSLTVSSGLEFFFNHFTSDKGNLTRTLVEQSLLNSFLYIQDSKLFCSLVSNTTTSPEYNRKVFIKEIKTDLSSFENKEINDIIRSAGACCVVDDSYLYILKRFTQNNFTNWSFTSNELFDFDSKKSVQKLNSTQTSFRTIQAFTYNDIVNCCEIEVISGVNYFKTSSDSKQDLIKSIHPISIKSNLLRTIGDSKVVSGKTNILDYYDLNNKGARIDYNIETIIGEYKNVEFNGFTYPNNVAYDLNKSPFTNNFLHALPENNCFGSKAFRIPILTKMTNNSLIVGYDIRRCTGWDYDEIDGGIAISNDGGRTWGDYKVVFPRINQAGYRTHDVNIVVDSDKNSSEYGRVWAIAKSWNANVDSLELQWWLDNPDSYDVVMSYSDDNGVNWTTPYSIKELFGDAKLVSGGCQAGITLEDGVLIMPIYNSASQVSLMYKEQGGDWKITDWTPTTSYVNESSAIQDKDGSILVSCRSRNNDRIWFRKQTLLGAWELDNSIGIKKDVGCQNSFFRHRDKYYYIQPNFNLNSNNGRKYTTLYVSEDLQNWTELIQLTGNIDGASGYSAIYVDDNIFCAIFEDSNTQHGYAVPEIKAIDLTCYNK